MIQGDGETYIVAIIARNVRAIRRSAKLSQEALADKAGLDRTYISQIERRQKNMTVTTLARIATALDRQPADLLADDPSLKPGLQPGSKNAL